MNVKNYFKFEMKPPKLEEEELNAVNKAFSFNQKLQACQSRLESIEICNNNEKQEDAILLSKFLVVDICNLVLSFYNQNFILEYSEVAKALEKIPNSEIVNEFENRIVGLDFSDFRSENSELIEERLFRFLYFLENSIKEKHPDVFENPLVLFKKRRNFQIILSIFIFLGLLVFGSKLYVLQKPLQVQDFLEFGFAQAPRSPIENSDNFTVPFEVNGEWNKISSNLSAESMVSVFRIIPLHQKNARIQIRNLKLFDKEEKLVYENPLIYYKSFMLEAVKYLWLENVKPGQLVDGKALELESINGSPSIYFTLEKPTKMYRYSFEMRAIKNNKKFTD